ncbi:protein Skeletor [Tropilaelaps mercedesae]|uniref:Protein Skeletor n=1 Tax=Tropilaelaps mercedesae TaxID=418985 RepID=A0A1V9XPK4_9ACAR|nr:protein Skeletor [Tropilaelaps mercedesae]
MTFAVAAPLCHLPQLRSSLDFSKANQLGRGGITLVNHGVIVHARKVTCPRTCPTLLERQLRSDLQQLEMWSPRAIRPPRPVPKPQLWTRQLLPYSASSQPYYGVRIGKFTQYFHDVAGEVFVMDDKTLFIKGFSYDGQGPDAYFWAGTSQKTDGSGFIIPDERGSLVKLGQYRNKDLVIRLPDNKSVRNIRWISVWCKKFSANFADLYLPRNLQIPKPVTVEKLPTWDHGVTSGPVTIIDSQTFLVPGIMYDGLGPGKANVSENVAINE